MFSLYKVPLSGGGIGISESRRCWPTSFLCSGSDQKKQNHGPFELLELIQSGPGDMLALSRGSSFHRGPGMTSPSR